MSNPSTPSSSMLMPNVGNQHRKLSYHGPSPLGGDHRDSKVVNTFQPSTPYKLKDIDPAIVFAVIDKSRSAKQEPKQETEHVRNESSSTVVGPPILKLEKSTGTASKSPMLSNNWRERNVNQSSSAVNSSVTDPFCEQSTATSQASSVVSSQDDEDTVVKNGEKSPTPPPRADRDTTQISAENAQGFYRSAGCVFVANLAATSSDTALQSDVDRVFSVYGQMFTKIRRDRSGMPYAFCQYTKEEDADKALASGHGLIICGRPCRVERARANRSVYLSRTAGGSISEEQARDILKEQGPIERLWYPTDTDKEIYRLADGIWATFTFFEDAKDARIAFRDSQEFRLEVPYYPEDHQQPRSATFKGFRFSPMQSTPLRGLRSSNSFNWRSQIRSDNRSIFIGGLPADVTIGALRDAFESCGSIRNVELQMKGTGRASSLNISGFVEFVDDIGAKNALSRVMHYGNQRLRIEPRQTHDHSTPRNFSSMASPRRLTPRTPQHGAQHNGNTGTPASMVPIYENTQQGATIVPQTPAYAPPTYYGPSYYAGYYPGSGATTPGYAPPGTPGAPVMGHYTAYPNYAYPMVYPTQVNGETAAVPTQAVANNSSSDSAAGNNTAVSNGSTQ